MKLLDIQWGGDSSSYQGYLTGGTPPPAPSVVPIAPPASLFPGTTQAIAAGGPAAIGTATKTFSDASSGVDTGKMFEAIKAASARGADEGQAKIMSAMGASGMATSSDAMRSVADFQLQHQNDLLVQLNQLQMANEGIKMAGAQGLMDTYGNAGMAFAPTQEVVGGNAGPSAFQQVTSAATGGALALATIMSAGSDAGWWCWIAAELFGGWQSAEVFHVRNFLATRKSFVGRTFLRLYKRYGKRVATYIRTHQQARVAVKWAFEKLIVATFNWRMN